MDLNSFVDFFLMMEVTKDIDPYRSAYYTRKRTAMAVRFMGPIWFNFAFGLVDCVKVFNRLYVF